MENMVKIIMITALVTYSISAVVFVAFMLFKIKERSNAKKAVGKLLDLFIPKDGAFAPSNNKSPEVKCNPSAGDCKLVRGHTHKSGESCRLSIERTFPFLDEKPKPQSVQKDCFSDKVKCDDCKLYLDKSDAQDVLVSGNGTNIVGHLFYCPIDAKEYESVYMSHNNQPIYRRLMVVDEDGSPIGYTKKPR